MVTASPRVYFLQQLLSLGNRYASLEDARGCSIPKIQILKYSQTRSKFKMNFKFCFKMFICNLISTSKI
jgi:hypothetical protein